MEQPYYLLLGAGAFIMIAALFLKKGSNEPEAVSSPAVQKHVERAEMERALQRFVKQVKEENDQLAGEVRYTRQELHQILTAVESRLQAAEMKITKLSTRTYQAATAEAEQTGNEAAETNEDMLALQERYSRVFELKKVGLQIDEIAKRLGAGRGEIELIFSLAGPNERGKSHDQS